MLFGLLTTAKEIEKQYQEEQPKAQDDVKSKKKVSK